MVKLNENVVSVVNAS